MSAMASQITSLTIVYSSVYSADRRKHQSSASSAFTWGIRRWPVNSPHKRPVTRKMIPSDDVSMYRNATNNITWETRSTNKCRPPPIEEHENVIRLQTNTRDVTGLPLFHDDVIKWKHFPRHWPFVRGIHRSPVDSPHKGQWRGALMFSLICAQINGSVNNGDLRRYRAHHDVIVMHLQSTR